MTKHVGIDQYKYSGYGIGFDRKWEFSFGSNEFGRNVIILGANMSKKYFSLGKDFARGLDNAAIYAEKLYSINFAENNKKFCLGLHCNGANSYLFVNGTDSEIVTTPLCLRNI